MPAKRGKRTAAKIPAEVENQSNIEEQGTEQPPAKKKGRGRKRESEQVIAPDKKTGRGRKNKANQEPSDESMGPSKDENEGEATKTVPKRGQSSKKTETETPKDKDGEVLEPQRKGAIRAAKRGVGMAEEGDEKEQKPTKARGRKAGNKPVDSGDGEPAVKKSQPKTKEEGIETKPKRKGRQQKNAPKGKEGSKRDNPAGNGDSVQSADIVGLDGRELRVAVEHW
jgi:hypothetical protein